MGRGPWGFASELTAHSPWPFLVLSGGTFPCTRDKLNRGWGYAPGMPNLVIVGAGTAGTILANRLRKALDRDWAIRVIDRDDEHHYQPGYLFIPFGKYTPDRVVQPRQKHLPKGVDFIEAAIDRVDTQDQTVELKNGLSIPYDWLVIATGTTPRPDMTPGMTDPVSWHKTVFDFYTLEGATKLHDALENFKGGKLLVHICEMPIKCPVAPLEFAFLADDYFRGRHMRHKVDIQYVTPLDGAFTKPVASKTLSGLLEDRSVRLTTDFAVESIDGKNKLLKSFDGRELPFDLLVTVPPNMGAQCIIDSGLGDDMGFVPVDKHTLQSVAHKNIFAIGDATNAPTSKAGAVAHFEADIFVENFLAAVQSNPFPHRFDGHANCFVELGRGEALLLDFNYDTQPLTGTFPLPGVGPMKLLGASHINHLGKMAFEKIYWNVLLPGHDMPIPSAMSMAGKNLPKEA